MTELQTVIDTLDNAADSFDGIATKEQKKIYDEVLLLAKDLDTDASGKVKQSIANLKRLTQIKAHLSALSKGKEWVAGISQFSKYFGILQQQQNAYFADHFPELTLSETAKKKHELQKQIAVQNTMEALMGSGLKANVTDKLNDILLRAVTSGAKFADLQEELRTHLLGKDGGQGAFARYATTYATTALSQFTGQNNKLLTDDLDTEWFMYVGSNKETTRPFCEACTRKKYIHRSEIHTMLTGHIHIVGGEDVDVPIYAKTGLPYGMIEGTNEENFQINVGGWNCRHQLVPVADAVVPKNIRDAFAKSTPTNTEKTTPIDLTAYKDQISSIEQYIADHPKSAKIKGYLADIMHAAGIGDSDNIQALLLAAKKDIAKFNAAKNAVAKKKAALQQAKEEQLSAAQKSQMQAAQNYMQGQLNKYGSFVAFEDLFAQATEAANSGDSAKIYEIADQIDKLAKDISGLQDITNPMQWAKDYTYDELKQANDYVKGHISHWKNKGKGGEQLIATITNEMTNFLDKGHKTYEVVHDAFGHKITELQASIQKNKFQENLNTILQYTIDHPKSAKIKNYYDTIVDLEMNGKHTEAVLMQEEAIADIKKFTSAANSVAKKKGEKTAIITKKNDKLDNLLKFLKANENTYKHIHTYNSIKNAIEKGDIERATRYINECLIVLNKSFNKTALSKFGIPDKVDLEYVGGRVEMIATKDTLLSNIPDKQMKALTNLYEKETVTKADDRLRSNSSSQWQNLSAEEKLTITKYTQTYSYLNERLRNIPYYGQRTQEEYDRDVITLTNALAKCKTTENMVVRRGTSDFTIRELMKNLSEVKVGDKFTDGAFLSTAVNRRKGFHYPINLIIYVPKGAMGFYAEPASAFNDHSVAYDYSELKIWDGKERQTIGREMEWIGQRGSRFEVIKVQGKDIHLKMIGQLYKQP